MINSQFSNSRITSNSIEAFSLNEKSRFGEKNKEYIEYQTVEALYLIYEKKMKLFSGKKEISFDELIKKTSKKDSSIETKYTVFYDLRKKGYILKTALKFGADFRIYEKGVKPSEEHAKWLLFVTNSNNSLKWNDFAAKNRIAHSTKKRLLIAIVDEESDVTYFEISWIKP
jgi:tRNA-intron endonuclease